MLMPKAMRRVTRIATTREVITVTRDPRSPNTTMDTAVDAIDY